MSPKLLASLLAVSLALNLFAVGGVAYSNFSEAAGDDPDAGVESVSAIMSLTEAETQRLYGVRDAAWTLRSEKRPEAENLRGELISLLVQPDFDKTRAEALWVQRNALRQQRVVATMTEMHGFLATLTPEQRAQFTAMAKERGFLRKLFGRNRKK